MSHIKSLLRMLQLLQRLKFLCHDQTDIQIDQKGDTPKFHSKGREIISKENYLHNEYTSQIDLHVQFMPLI